MSPIEKHVYDIISNQCKQICDKGKVDWHKWNLVLKVCEISNIVSKLYDIPPEQLAVIMKHLIKEGHIAKIETNTSMLRGGELGDRILSFVPTEWEESTIN